VNQDKLLDNIIQAMYLIKNDPKDEWFYCEEKQEIRDIREETKPNKRRICKECRDWMDSMGNPEIPSNANCGWNK